MGALVKNTKKTKKKLKKKVYFGGILITYAYPGNVEG